MKQQKKFNTGQQQEHLAEHKVEQREGRHVQRRTDDLDDDADGHALEYAVRVFAKCAGRYTRVASTAR